MSIDFSKFNKMVDLDGLKKDIAEASEKGIGEYREVPVGNYEVKIEKMELGETGENSKVPGSPMLKVMFRILAGDYENSCVFMNQVMREPFQIHLTNTFLKSLDSGVEVVFDDFVQYASMIMDIHEAIDGKLEYALEYGEKKGFKTFKITDIYEVE